MDNDQIGPDREQVEGEQPSVTAADLANKLLEQAFVPAVQTVIELCNYATQDNIRLSAAKTIITHNTGTKSGGEGKNGDFWEELQKRVTTKQQ